MQQGRLGRFLLHFLGALLVVFFTVEHVRTGDLVVSATHQAEFNLVLDVFNMEGAATRSGAHQGSNDALCQLVHCFANAGRGRALGAMHGQEGLHHGDCYLVGLEGYNRAVAPNDLVLVERVGRWVVAVQGAVQCCSAGLGCGGWIQS